MDRKQDRRRCLLSASAFALSFAGWPMSPSVAQDNEVVPPRRSRLRIASRNVASETPTDAEALRQSWNSDAEADWPAAGVLASISEMSYLPPNLATRRFEALGFQKIQPFQVESLSGYVVSADDVSVVAFRGTDDPIEWLVNLDVFSHSTPHGEIHNGYYKAYRVMKPQVAKLVAENQSPKVWITGHSLGGALALVCAYDMLAQENKRPFGVMTFGQPMVVDRYLANYLDDRLSGRYAHFVNEQDIVPRLPPGYAHCGSLVWFVNGKVVRSKPRYRPFTTDYRDRRADRLELMEPLSEAEFADLQADLKRSTAASNSSIRRASFSKQSPEWIQDHSITVYRQRIQSVAE